MNDEQSAELVEELENLFAWSWGKDLKTGRQVLAELGDDPAQHHRRETMFANKAVEIFDRLLADRAEESQLLLDEANRQIVQLRNAFGNYVADRAATVAEPDVETVERVAKAIYNIYPHTWNRYTHPYDERADVVQIVDWDDESTWKHDLNWRKERCRAEARAAIVAMPSCADDNWLDDALDSLSPGAVVYRTMRIREGGWEAVVAVPEGPDEDGWFNYTNTAVSGTGTTRKAAILDAVQKAKETSK